MENSFKLLLTVIVLLTITVSCGETAKKEQEEHAAEKKETVKTVDTHENGSELHLNDGKLWKANYETTKGISNMQELLTTFSGGESQEAYAALKNNLEKEFATIITECTMEGEPHKQLHNFLVPMKELFNGLGSSDLTTCKTSFETLNKHLAAYSTYFK